MLQSSSPVFLLPFFFLSAAFAKWFKCIWSLSFDSPFVWFHFARYADMLSVQYAEFISKFVVFRFVTSHSSNIYISDFKFQYINISQENSIRATKKKNGNTGIASHRSSDDDGGRCNCTTFCNSHDYVLSLQIIWARNKKGSLARHAPCWQMHRIRYYKIIYLYKC